MAIKYIILWKISFIWNEKMKVSNTDSETGCL